MDVSGYLRGDVSEYCWINYGSSRNYEHFVETAVGFTERIHIGNFVESGKGIV